MFAVQEGIPVIGFRSFSLNCKVLVLQYYTKRQCVSFGELWVYLVALVEYDLRQASQPGSVIRMVYYTTLCQ